MWPIKKSNVFPRAIRAELAQLGPLIKPFLVFKAWFKYTFSSAWRTGPRAKGPRFVSQLCLFPILGHMLVPHVPSLPPREGRGGDRARPAWVLNNGSYPWSAHLSLSFLFPPRTVVAIKARAL